MHLEIIGHFEGEKISFEPTDGRVYMLGTDEGVTRRVRAYVLDQETAAHIANLNDRHRTLIDEVVVHSKWLREVLEEGAARKYIYPHLDRFVERVKELR